MFSGWLAGCEIDKRDNKTTTHVHTPISHRSRWLAYHHLQPSRRRQMRTQTIGAEARLDAQDGRARGIQKKPTAMTSMFRSEFVF